MFYHNYIVSLLLPPHLSATFQMSEYIEKVLHVKSEDLRLYDLSDEENPVLLDDENRTVNDLKFTDGQKLLVESERMYACFSQIT